MNKKGEKRRQFTLKEKLIILEKIDSAKRRADVAKEFGIAPSTLSNFVKDRKKIEEKINDCSMGPQRKKIRSALNEGVDKATFLWLQDVRSRNIPISGPMIREKALEFAKLLKIDTFQASVGWLCRFRERYGINSRAIGGEENSVPTERVTEWHDGEIKEIVAKYNRNDIFNAVETGLFYQLLPHQTLTVKGDPCEVGEKSKLRLTALFCCNASGTEKLKPLIIGRYANPRCLKNVKSHPYDYRANQKAWMTQQLFSEWLKNFDAKMGSQKRKILLLIDNCSAHILTCKFENIKVEFLPQNCTAILQPLDLGIIRAVKMHYRSRLIKKISLKLDSDDGKKIDVKEACDMICAAWWSVKQSTICKSWKASIIETSDDEIQTTEIDTAEAEVENEVREMWNSVAADTAGVNYEDYIEADNNLMIASELTEKDINENLQPSMSNENEDSEEDDNGNGVASSDISFSEAIDGLKKIQGYLSCSVDIPENIFEKLNDIENTLVNTAKKNLETK